MHVFDVPFEMEQKTHQSKSLKWLNKLNPWRSLRARLVLAFAFTTIISCAVILAVASVATTLQVSQGIHSHLGSLSIQAVNILDRGMFERQREIQLSAGLPLFSGVGTPQQKQNFLNLLHRTYIYYAWIGNTHLLD